jgi:hypothetical protein
MPEPARAKSDAAQSISIDITYGGSGYSPVPDEATVANDGSVYFICSRACWVWTMVDDVLTNAFKGETKDYLPCAAGNNGPFTPAVLDAAITIIPLAVNSNPPSENRIPDNLTGTIHVGSGAGEKELEK